MKTHLADPWFHICLRAALDTPGLLTEYDRLRGTNLSRAGTVLDLNIDDACDRLVSEVPGFVEFVREYVYERLPRPASPPGVEPGLSP